MIYLKILFLLGISFNDWKRFEPNIYAIPDPFIVLLSPLVRVCH